MIPRDSKFHFALKDALLKTAMKHALQKYIFWTEPEISFDITSVCTLVDFGGINWEGGRENQHLAYSK